MIVDDRRVHDSPISMSPTDSIMFPDSGSKASPKKALVLAAFTILILISQVFGADWLTDGGDSKRNNWQRNETILNRENVGGLQLLWKTKLDNQPRQMHSLLEPLVIGQLETRNGTRELVIQAGVSDNLYA